MMGNRELIAARDELEFLLARGRAVINPHLEGPSAARAAAQLGIVVRGVANTFGLPEMRAACAWLAARPWPQGPTGCRMRDPIMSVAKALALTESQVSVRDALAFWATETDPTVWQSVFSAAA